MFPNGIYLHRNTCIVGTHTVVHVRECHVARHKNSLQELQAVEKRKIFFRRNVCAYDNKYGIIIMVGVNVIQFIVKVRLITSAPDKIESNCRRFVCLEFEILFSV